MSEQRKSEITVGTGVADWGEELIAQWNVLGDTIARSVQQRARQEQEQGQRLGNASELERMRAALAENEAKAAAAARESAVRLDATRHEYETKVALLQQELEQRGRTYEPPQFMGAVTSERADGGAVATCGGESQHPAEAQWGAENEWEASGTETSWGSKLAGPRSTLAEQWSRARSGPYLVPVVGFLAGLAVMVSLYPLLQRPSRSLAKETANAKLLANGPQAGEAARGGNPSQAAANTGTPARDAGATVAADGATATSTLNAKPTPDAAEPGNYAVLLAGGRLLTPDKPGAPSAVYEARLALRAGYDSISVYQRNDRYMAAVLFRSREEAERGLKSINADFDSRWKRTSSIVPVSEWCRVKGAMEPVIVNGVEVAVWSCNKTPTS